MKSGPLRFATLHLQQEPIRLLTASLAKGRIAQSYIFVGARSVGKTRAAKTFAALLQCLEPTTGPSGAPDACGRCLSCKRVAAGSHPDVTFLRPLGTEIRVGQVRQMQELALLHPYLGKWRIFIIDPADRLNESSSNSLLKILEEAPERVVFILVAEQLEHMLPTIRSRAEIVTFHHPSHRSAREVIAQATGVSATTAACAYALTGGAFGAALALAGQEAVAADPLPLREAQVRFLEDLDRFAEHVQAGLQEAPSLEAALAALENPELPSFPPLLVSRRALVRGLLLAESLPAAFPVLFARVFLDTLDRGRRGVEKVLDGVIARQKAAYASEILKDMDKQFGPAVQALFQGQLTAFLECLRQWYEDIFHFAHTGDESWLLNLDRKEDIMALSLGRGLGAAESGIRLLSRSLELLSRHVQPGLVLEHVLTSIGGNAP
ncbi:MAG: DNA polymerase III delta prime subunit [Candidatus Ozemobacter sibiricus]|uniref:DNA polymerase III delta prime subunit n=1 Tax=Candidatus Ozemobacter sibiricus TaxID=2268124 RepID=A0A367ZVB3_9BACT|nr:MAG: DNA polymerase III delta prime subunit [Candidatus Ozemobacter sibiricus]